VVQEDGAGTRLPQGLFPFLEHLPFYVVEICRLIFSCVMHHTKPSKPQTSGLFLRRC